MKRKPVLPMLKDTLYKDKPPKKRCIKKQDNDENQDKQPAKSTNKDKASNDNTTLSGLAKMKKNNKDTKNKTIGRGKTRGNNKIVKKVTGVAGDDAEQSKQITCKSAHRAGN